MNNLPKEKQNHLILAVLGTVVAVFAIWFLLISSQRRTLEAVKGRTEAAQSKVAKAEEALKRGAATDLELGVVGQKLKAAEDMMASGDMYSWVIRTVNDFVGNRKVSIPQFSKEIVGDVAVIPRFPYRSASFSLRGTGFFHDFGKFVADFENAFPYFRIQNLDLSPLTTPGQNPKRWSFDLIWSP